jgi:putative flippase GtrA
VRLRLILKLIRYATVSAISTAVSLTILGTLVSTNATTAGWANVVATAVGTVPSFELNRRWVWKKRGRRSVLGEMGPFWVLSFIGLGLSTLAVNMATSWASASGLGATARTVAAEFANVGTFGSLWVVQYVILDRVLFPPGRHAVIAVAPASASLSAGPAGPAGDAGALKAA